MKKQKTSIYAMFVILVSFGLFSTGCDKKEEAQSTGELIEEVALTPGWNNYLVAATSELLDDCITLWASWNGPEGLTEDEKARLGADFFSKNAGQIGAEGFAKLFSSAGPNNTHEGLKSEPDAIQMIIKDGCITIAGEVGEQKIGGPNGFARNGDMAQAVLQVESWYSWNSITDYADNIVSIKNSYWGGCGLSQASANSISAFVKSKNAALDEEVTDAIDAAYAAIKGMKAPFRDNLKGDEVKAAMEACANLADVLEKKVLPLLNGTDYDFTPVLNDYAYKVVVATYKAMKDDAYKLYNAAVAYQANPTQSNLGKVCEAWRTNRIPWEQSEAFLFGPADVLGLDPSLDSWPLDQNDIWGILNDINNGKYTSVSQIIPAIQKDEVRGFHTIELLLFKDGQNRQVK